MMKSLPNPWYFANSRVRLARAATLLRCGPAEVIGVKGACALCFADARAVSEQARPVAPRVAIGSSNMSRSHPHTFLLSNPQQRSADPQLH